MIARARSTRCARSRSSSACWSSSPSPSRPVLVWYGLVSLGWRPRYTVPVAVLVALAVTQLLARGMTSPLREMTAAARAMARGDYSRRVRATSRDEVGELARAFNRMAADLAAVDRAAPRAGRQRQPRAAHPAHRAAGHAGEPRGRRGRARPGHAAGGAGADRTAWADWSRSCSTCRARGRQRAAGPPGRRVAPVLEAAVRRGRDDRARRAVHRRRSPPGARPGGRRPAAPGARQPARQRRAAQPARRHGAGDGRARGRTACASRSPTTGPASHRPIATGSSTASTAARRPPRTAAPASASPSPGGR